MAGRQCKRNTTTEKFDNKNWWSYSYERLAGTESQLNLWLQPLWCHLCELLQHSILTELKWTHAPRNRIEWITEMSQKQNMGFQQWYWTKITLTGKYDFGHLTKKLVERRSYIIHHVDIWPLHFKFPSCNVPIVWIVKSSYESNYSCLVKLCHKCGLQECNHGQMIVQYFYGFCFSRILLNFHRCMCPSECNNCHMTLRFHVPRCPCFMRH